MDIKMKKLVPTHIGENTFNNASFLSIKDKFPLGLITTKQPVLGKCQELAVFFVPLFENTSALAFSDSHNVHLTLMMVMERVLNQSTLVSLFQNDFRDAPHDTRETALAMVSNGDSFVAISEKLKFKRVLSLLNITTKRLTYSIISHKMIVMVGNDANQKHWRKSWKLHLTKSKELQSIASIFI